MNILLVPLLLSKHRWPVEAWARALKVCCGVWHQYVSSRFCKQKGVVPAFPTDAQSDWYIERGLFKPYLNRICFAVGCVILLEQTTAIRGYCFHERVYRVYNSALGGGTSQSSILTNGRTQGFLAEHCPKNHSAWFLPIVHPSAMCFPGESHPCTRWSMRCTCPLLAILAVHRSPHAPSPVWSASVQPHSQEVRIDWQLSIRSRFCFSNSWSHHSLCA